MSKSGWKPTLILSHINPLWIVLGRLQTHFEVTRFEVSLENWLWNIFVTTFSPMISTLSISFISNSAGQEEAEQRNLPD